MSAVFKNSKKKLSQLELRRYMNEHKSKLNTVQKIDSPLAKYTDSGQLTCVLCKSIVRSEAVWNVHINTKQHKENVSAAKKLKEKTDGFTSTLKRPLSPAAEGSTKKIKSILKSSSTQNVPEDFFDSNSKDVKPVEVTTEIINTGNEISSNTQEVKVIINTEELPEGFFDDPKQDAKARHLEYKDPIEEEWEKFQKEIKAVDNKSAEIIAEDQEEATTERQIDEIEEQMRNWSRVLSMERKKEEVKVTIPKKTTDENEDISSEDDADFDEFLDWRAKKS